MNHRRYQVALTYLRHWPFWLAVIAYVATCAFAARYVWFPNPSFFRTRNVFPEVQQPAPTVNLTARTALDEVSRDTRSIFWNAEELNPIRVETSQPFPKLTALHVVGTFRPDATLQFLRAMPNLQEFSFLDDLPRNSMQYIGELQHLRHLRLYTDQNFDLDQHPLPASLKTLDIIRVTNQTRLFDQLRKLPNLRTLILQGPLPQLFNESDWERLRALPRLTRLYLRGNSANPDRGQAELLRVQQILPHVKVRAAEVSDLRTNLWNCVALMGILVWALLIVQLQSQFAHCGSRVIPNYASAHLEFAVLLWTATTLLHVTLLWQGGCSLLAAFAGALAIPGLLWGLAPALMYSSRRQHQLGPIHPFLAIAICFQAFPVTQMVSHYFLSDLDWFLDGRQPLFAGAIAAAGLVAPALVVLRLPRLHSVYQEFGMGVPPLGLSPSAWTAWTKNVSRARTGPRRTLIGGDQDARLDAVLATPEPRSMTRLWLAGNVISGRQLCLAILVVWVFVYIGMTALHWLLSDAFPVQVSGMSLMGCVWTDMITVGLVLFWRKGPMLGLDLLRPVSRKQFVQNLFQAVARDLLPLLICHLFVMLCLPWILDVHRLPNFFTITTLSYCFFRALAFYATFLFVLAQRRVWLMIAVLAGVWWFVSMSGMYLALATFRTEAWAPAIAIPAYLGGCVAMLLCLVWLKRYWQRVELA